MAAEKKNKPVRKVACEGCGSLFAAARGCPPCPKCGSEDTFRTDDGEWPCSSSGCTTNKFGPEEKINRGGRCGPCRSGDGPVRKPFCPDLP